MQTKTSFNKYKGVIIFICCYIFVAQLYICFNVIYPLGRLMIEVHSISRELNRIQRDIDYAKKELDRMSSDIRKHSIKQ